MPLVLIVTFAVLASMFNAWSSVIQRGAAGQPNPEELFRRNFIKNLSKNPKWIGAAGLAIIAYLFQAAAVRDGSLILVEPLLTTDLIFIMMILHFSKRTPVGKKEWLSILMICFGLSGMLISANPRAGQKPYDLTHLILSSAIILAVIAFGIYLVRRTKSHRHRAALSGVAAGFSFALVIAFTKIVSIQLSHGLLFVLTHWQVWALAASGIVGTIMSQNTYGAGPLASSQPAMELAEPLVSIFLGVYLFSDRVNLNAINLFFAVLSAVIAGVGIATLGRSKRLSKMTF